jgi:hypothetical protein
MKIRSRAIPLRVLLLLLTSCAARPAATQPVVPIASQSIESPTDQPQIAGPTVMSRVDNGYELRNRLFRVVISDQTGDVIFWGAVDQPRNMVFQRGIYTTLTGLPDAPLHGYIEQRDEQTWQFFGEDDNHVTWRKIYCLERSSLLVSIMVQNNRPAPLVAAIQINADFVSLRVQHHDPELFIGVGGYATVEIKGYNEFRTVQTPPPLPVIIQSDTFYLKPQERQSYTSRWRLLP